MSAMAMVTDRRAAALQFLAIARQADPDPAVASVYLLSLRDVDETLIERACHELAKSPRREFEAAMPSVGDIRERVERIQRQDAQSHARAHLPPAAGERTFACARCQDDPAGWLPLMRCPDVPCERPREHDGHWFTAKCPCWLVKHGPSIRLRDEQLQSEKKGRAVHIDIVEQFNDGAYRWERER